MTAKKKKTQTGAGRKTGGSSEASELSFEEALERLESIVSRLEEGDVPLEESLEAYAEGTRLARRCMDRLARAEAMIKKLSEDTEGFRLDSTSLDEEEGTEDDDGSDNAAPESDERDELF
jgi:exodeoxyribonuclease VII small subunit